MGLDILCSLTEHVYCAQYGSSLYIREPKQNIILCKSGASPVGHDQSGLCMALKAVMNCS